MARSEELQVVVRAVDEASATLKKIHADLQTMGANAQQTTAHVDALGNKLTSLGQRVKEGFGTAIGQGIFGAVESGFHSLLDFYPKVIEMGSSYLDQLHMIQLETGMTAEQTSALVGATKSLGMSTDALEPLFAKLGKNLAGNEAKFAELGVATRDAAGVQLDAYTIVDNLRRQISAQGEGLLSTAAAMDLFGKAGYQMLPFLQLTNDQMQQLNDNTARWGGIYSQEAIDGAHRFGVEMASLQTGILDVATNIFAALSPYLAAFVDEFAKFVQAHLQDIINFAVQVGATIMGILGGLFGFSVDFSKVTAGAATGIESVGTASEHLGQKQKTSSSGIDAFTSGIRSQIRAIDDHIRALTEASRKRKAIEEEEKLRASLASARAQLADLQGNTPFLGGLSAAEQVLALQKHAQDIANAKKAVGAAQESLGNFELDQRDQAERALLERQKQRLNDGLAAHKTANAAIGADYLKMGAGIQNTMGGALKNIGVDVTKFQATAQKAFADGAKAAQGFLDVLLGTYHASSNVHAAGAGFREGGLVNALQTLGGVAQEAGKFIGDAVKFISGVLPKVDSSKGLDTFLFGGRPPFVGPYPFAIGPWNIGHNAEGGPVGLNGPELTWVGEKGPEYIVPNGGRGGTGVTIVNNFNSTWPPTEEQARNISDVVSRRLAYQLNHAPVTSFPYGSF